MSKHIESDDYKNALDLLALFSEAKHRLAQIEAEANLEFVDAMDSLRGEYTLLQSKLTQTEAALETIARTHPEWFGEKKSVKTPYGTLKLTESTKLEVSNEELTLALLANEAERNPEFKRDNYVRVVTSLNLEALETLEDEVLKRLRIKRVTTDSFSLQPSKVNLGEAVKQTAEKVAA